MTTQTTLSFEVDVYLTKRQLQILESVGATTKQSVSEFLSDAMDPIIESSIEDGELFYLPGEIWSGYRKQVKTRKPRKDQLVVKTRLSFSGKEAEVVGSLMPLIQKYYPGLFDIFAEHAIDSRLEAMEDESDYYHIPQNEAKKLLAEWKSATED